MATSGYLQRGVIPCQLCTLLVIVSWVSIAFSHCDPRPKLQNCEGKKPCCECVFSVYPHFCSRMQTTAGRKSRKSSISLSSRLCSRLPRFTGSTSIRGRCRSPRCSPSRQEVARKLALIAGEIKSLQEHANCNRTLFDD
jgi:hypothetical protein